MLQSSLSPRKTSDPRLQEVCVLDATRLQTSTVTGWSGCCRVAACLCHLCTVIMAAANRICHCLRCAHCLHDVSACEASGMLALQVSSCLASIAQGVHTKSRAWVARRAQQQPGVHSQPDSMARGNSFAQSSPFGVFTNGDLSSGDPSADVAGSLVDGLLGMARTANGTGG